MNRADWEKYYGWVPAADARGHALGPGRVNLTMVSCPGCPATTDDRGHQSVRCRVNGCDAPTIFPPGHVGPLPAQG